MDENMGLHPDVQNWIDVLNTYKLVDNINEFNIIHIYPKENCYPDGYYCAKFIDVHLYNSFTMEKQVLETRHDALTFMKKGPDKVVAYVDRSIYMEVPDGYMWFLKFNTPNLFIYHRMKGG